jgi:phosphotransacetylase
MISVIMDCDRDVDYQLTGNVSFKFPDLETARIFLKTCAKYTTQEREVVLKGAWIPMEDVCVSVSNDGRMNQKIKLSEFKLE